MALACSVDGTPLILLPYCWCCVGSKLHWNVLECSRWHVGPILTLNVSDNVDNDNKEFNSIQGQNNKVILLVSKGPRPIFKTFPRTFRAVSQGFDFSRFSP